MFDFNSLIVGLSDSLNCTKCNGTGIRKALEGFSPDSSLGRDRECYSCRGNKTFLKPNLDLILEAVKGRKGLRTAKPKDNKRAAYVWRMARFHGGVDMRMPIMAQLDIEGDPYVKVLDSMADALAKQHFGSDLVAAYRWGTALGVIPRGES